MSEIHRIVCAANRSKDKWYIVLGVRHWDLLMHNAAPMLNPPEWEEGFVDNRGNFLTREEAYVVAENARQIIRRVGGDDGRLFSENLY